MTSIRFKGFLMILITHALVNCKTQTGCGQNVNTCDWYPWGNWQACQVTCGGGSQIRTRGICCRDIDKNDSYKCLKNCNLTQDTYTFQTCNEFCLNGGTFTGGNCVCLPGCSGRCCESGTPITSTTTAATTTTDPTTTSTVTSTTTTGITSGQSANNERYKCGKEEYQDCHCVFGNKKTKIRKDVRDYEFGTYGILIGFLFSIGTYVFWNCFDKPEFKRNGVKPALRKFSTLDPPNLSLNTY